MQTHTALPTHYNFYKNVFVISVSAWGVMVGSTVFSWTVTACVEPDSALGKGSEAGQGGDGLSLEGLGRAGGRTRVSEMEGAFGKQAVQTLQTQMRKLGPGAAHHALPECPKQGRQRELVLCPRYFPHPSLGLVNRLPRLSSALSPHWPWGHKGAAATLSPVQATPASSTHASPVWLGRGLGCFLLPPFWGIPVHILGCLCPCKHVAWCHKCLRLPHGISAAGLPSASPLFHLTADVSVLSGELSSQRGRCF